MRRTIVRLAAIAFFALASGVPAGAAPLEIQFTGLDLLLDGNTIDGTTSVLGGNGNPHETDAIDLMTRATVPEPSTLVLVGLGTIVVAGRLRRRRAE